MRKISDVAQEASAIDAALFRKNASGKPVALIGANNELVHLRRTNPQGVCLLLGDSRIAGGTLRVANSPDHRPWWGSSTSFVNTNLGGTTWIIRIALDGNAPSGTTGTLETDGAGKLRWTVTGDTAGAYVDVSAGGFFMLSSGTSPYLLSVACRNSTAANVTLPGAGTGAVSISGISSIISYELLGFTSWIAGAMGEVFSDYANWGISGDTSENLLSRTDQALAATDPACVVLLIGVNDTPTTAALATATIGRIKAIIDKCCAKSPRVFVVEDFPTTSLGSTTRQYLSQVQAAIRNYCRTKPGARFCPTYDALLDPTTLPMVLRSGAYHTDNLHLKPYGAWLAAIEVVRQMSLDYSPEKMRQGHVDTYDSTLGTGAWNTNPNLKGTGGTITASKGITGTCPDGWTMSRNSAQQTCTTGFDTEPNGQSWFSLSVANSGAADYHNLTQSVAIPAGVAVGDLFRVFVEIKIFSAVGITTCQANALSNSNNIGTYAFWITRNLDNFTSENPTLQLYSEPVTKLSGMTSVTLEFRLGGAAGSSGKVGIRSFRVEKV